MSDKKKYWIITPSKNTSHDSTAMPAENEDDARKALEYAQEVLESQWDEVGLDIDDPDIIPNVSMEIVWLDPDTLLGPED
jgi:hypothetical protein